MSGEGHFLSVKTKIAAIFLPGSLKLAVDENQRLTFLNQRPNIPEYESVFRPQIGEFEPLDAYMPRKRNKCSISLGRMHSFAC